MRTSSPPPESRSSRTAVANGFYTVSRTSPPAPWRGDRSPASSEASSDSEDDGPGPDQPRRGDDRNLRINIPDEAPTVPALATPSAKAGGHPWPFTAQEIELAVATPRARRSGSVNDWLRAVNKAGEEPPPVSAMPHEILLHILRSVTSPSDLRRALLVCKAWCQCGVELLWHKPTFNCTANLIKMLVILAGKNQTFPYDTFIRRLNFSCLSDHISDHILSRLTGCIRLERLTLSGCHQITDYGLTRMLDNVPVLVALDLSDCRAITDTTLVAISIGCPKLQGLNLSGCKSVTDRGVSALGTCKALRRLKLKGCELVTDAGLVEVIASCPLLLEVDLVGCKLATNATLWTLWKHSSHLRELTLSGIVDLTDGGFPSAENVMIAADGVTDPINDEVSKVGPPLPVQEYADMGMTSKFYFDHIRFLDLTSLTHLTDAAVEGIIKHAPRIRNLVLAKCTQLTDESLNAVCRLGKHLHYLHLGHVSSLTDRAVVRLARSCTRLRYIDLACCTNLTDMSVFELANSLPRLKRIGLVRVTNITDASVTVLLERTSLERIHLSYCEHITVGAIHFLLQKLHRLTHLSLTGVPAFRRSDLQAWCRQPPKDFNTHQRQAFCVYSGKGVGELRRYLAALLYISHQQAALANYPYEAHSATDTDTTFFNTLPDQRTMQQAMNSVRQAGLLSGSANGPRRTYRERSTPTPGTGTLSAPRFTTESPSPRPPLSTPPEHTNGFNGASLLSRLFSANSGASPQAGPSQPRTYSGRVTPQLAPGEAQAGHDFFQAAAGSAGPLAPLREEVLPPAAFRAPRPLHPDEARPSWRASEYTSALGVTLHPMGSYGGSPPSGSRHHHPRAMDDASLGVGTAGPPSRLTPPLTRRAAAAGGDDNPTLQRRRSEQELNGTGSNALDVPDRRDSASPMDLSDDERPPIDPDVMQTG